MAWVREGKILSYTGFKQGSLRWVYVWIRSGPVTIKRPRLEPQLPQLICTQVSLCLPSLAAHKKPALGLNERKGLILIVARGPRGLKFGVVCLNITIVEIPWHGVSHVFASIRHRGRGVEVTAEVWRWRRWDALNYAARLCTRVVQLPAGLSGARKRGLPETAFLTLQSTLSRTDLSRLQPIYVHARLCKSSTLFSFFFRLGVTLGNCLSVPEAFVSKKRREVLLRIVKTIFIIEEQIY